MIKEINKLIKPYIVKEKEGLCHLEIPLYEWDDLAVDIIGVVFERLEKLLKNTLKEELK